jgi:hypothetical protein
MEFEGFEPVNHDVVGQESTSPQDWRFTELAVHLQKTR